MASTYLSKTYGSSGSLTTWTFSFWIKRASNLGSDQRILSCDDDASGNQDDFIKFSGDNFQIGSYNSGYVGLKTTNRVFRDTSAWYHIVVVWDTTNGTADDRIRLYVNGVRETSFSASTNPSSSANSFINSNSYPLEIGRRGLNSTQYIDGSMTHVHFIDGTAYDASAFGETDATTGIWKPKTAPSVTYGTNGFFLKFENSGAFGTDSSGNANNFTVNGTMTQTIDTPSNVFATMNPLDNYYASSTFTNGNNRIVTNSGNMSYNTGTIAVSSGKWYVEAKVVDNADSNYHQIGIAETPSTSTSNWLGESATHYGLTGFDGKIWRNNSGTAYGVSSTTGDIIGMALDLDNNKLYFAKNGTWMNSAEPSAGTGGYSIVGASSTANGYYLIGAGDWENLSSATWDFNFGNGYFGTTVVSSAQNPDDGIGIFEYAVPTGYKALCTKSINAQEYD